MASQISVAKGEWICQGDDLVALAYDAERNWFNIFLEDTWNQFSRKTLTSQEIVPFYLSLHYLVMSLLVTARAHSYRQPVRGCTSAA